MNGRWNHAETSQARIAVAVLAGTVEYFRQNPHGVTPGVTFMADWLEPFVELERLDAVVEEVHRIQKEEAKDRERELLDRRAVLVRACQQRIKA